VRQNSNTGPRLEFLSRVVTKELQHLLYTDAKLFISPLSVGAVASFEKNADMAEIADAFVARFGRLQDTLGDKLVPALLVHKGEKLGPAIDNLDKAERFNWLESVDDWLAIRQLRNKMVHEYIEDPQILADALNAGHRFVPVLEKTSRILISASLAG
jgi:hypothetical protein